MSEEIKQESPPQSKYLEEILEVISSPIHKRIIKVYKEGVNPIQSMEAELGKILTEILNRED